MGFQFNYTCLPSTALTSDLIIIFWKKAALHIAGFKVKGKRSTQKSELLCVVHGWCDGSVDYFPLGSISPSKFPDIKPDLFHSVSTA